MRHKLSAVLALAVCMFGCTPVAAAEHWCQQSAAHPADVEFDHAIERSGGVTIAMREAQGVAFQRWDAELNRFYRKVLSLTVGPRAVELRKAQRAWLAWDSAETESDIALVSDAGTSAALIVSDVARERRRQRACVLKRIADDLANTAVD